jgi:outer membrane protein
MSGLAATGHAFVAVLARDLRSSVDIPPDTNSAMDGYAFRGADLDADGAATLRQIGTAWAGLQVARASIQAGQLEVRAAQLAFEGVNEEAKVGARTTIDVLDAEQEVLNARAGLVRARRDEYVAAYTLLAAIGRLTVDHLGLDVGEREAPGAYYEAVRDRNFGYGSTDDTVWRFDLRP